MGVMAPLLEGQPFLRTASNENRLPTAMAGRGGPPRGPPPPPNARVIPVASNRRTSFREAAGAVCRSSSGGGITLSESIRNSGAVLEELEAKNRTLLRTMEGLREELQSKDRDLQALNTTMNDRVDKKQKEIEQLRDNARASEMAIRGLEDEIRLLRKQNNDVDRASRHGQGRNTNQPPPPGDEELLSKLKTQVGQGEEEARSLRSKLATLQAQLDSQKTSQKSSDKDDKAAQSRISELEKVVAERDKEAKQLKGEVASLKASLAKAQQAAAAATKEADSKKGACNDDQLKDVRAKLKAAEDKLAAATAELLKLTKELDSIRKSSEETIRGLRAVAQSATARVQALDVQLNDAQLTLSTTLSQLAACKDEIKKLENEAEGLRMRGKSQQDLIKDRDARIISLQSQLTDLQVVVERQNKADMSEGLEKELEALRERCQAAEDVSHTHKMAATEAQALASISKNKADVLGSQLTESETRMEELRKRVAELEKAAREALARLCKIGELEAQLRSQEKLVISAETQRDSAQSSCRIFEKQIAALLEAAKSEKTKLEKDVHNGLDRESRLEAALAELRSRAAVAAIPSEVHNQVDQVGRLEKKAALQAQVHKLQMLLRMAEITKLEEHIKCTRRSDSVKEEKMGLLTYNLASAESQIAQDNVEAGQKRQAVREERMGVLNKKQKLEEDKMRTNEDSFNTQSKRLKEKLRDLEALLKAS